MKYGIIRHDKNDHEIPNCRSLRRAAATSAWPARARHAERLGHQLERHRARRAGGVNCPFTFPSNKSTLGADNQIVVTYAGTVCGKK
jgi:hypothetical protein